MVAFVLAVAPCSAEEELKNHQKLDEHLGWLIGDWEAKNTGPDGQPQKVRSKYKWIAKDQAIQLNLAFGNSEWEGLSIIFWDTSDGTIKMWGANSAGGNGQATMRVVGNELVWTNTVYGADGKKRVSDFSFRQEDKDSFFLKYTAEADGKEESIKVTRVVK